MIEISKIKVHAIYIQTASLQKLSISFVWTNSFELSVNTRDINLVKGKYQFFYCERVTLIIYSTYFELENIFYVRMLGDSQNKSF